MKKKVIQEWQTKSTKELEKLVEKIQSELTLLRTDLGAGKLKDVHQVKKKRRDLARAKTILRNKELTELSSEA